MNKLKSPSPKNALCQVWLKLAWWVFRRRFLNFVNVFSLFRNYLPLEKGVTLHMYQLEFPSPKDAMCQIWLILAQWFWRRRFLNFVDVFSLLRNILSPLGIWITSILFTQGCFVLSLVEIGSVVQEKKMYFRYFGNYLPLEKDGSLHLNKLESPYPRMLCAKFGWFWPSGSGVEDF